MKSNDICRARNLCSGCAACANICAYNAIEMKPDWRGFMYPHIDASKCADCGLCQKICPINDTYPSFEYTNGYAFVERDKQLLYKASSGGAFGVMARWVISRGGVVFGASMDSDYNVNYVGVESVEELQKLYGSKYVQSYVGKVYRDVKKALYGGRWVLFCGCPCQVSGLNHFLRKSYDKLITMDLICHGVPSQPYFKAYVHDILLNEAKKGGGQLFRFRLKAEACFDTQSKQGKSVLIGYQSRDFYMTHFLWGKGYRNSCYQCSFNGYKRPGDFTIGDFWNNKVAQLPIDDTHGASLIICNTEKAKILLEEYYRNGSCEYIPTLELAISKDGGNVMHSSKNDLRTDFCYFLFKLMGVNGPKLFFAIEKKLMHL